MRELTFPKSNALILIIKLRSGEDLMIETFRRFEVNRFIQQVCSERMINQISLKEADMYDEQLTQFNSGDEQERDDS